MYSSSYPSSESGSPVLGSQSLTTKRSVAPKVAKVMLFTKLKPDLNYCVKGTYQLNCLHLVGILQSRM